MARTHGTRSAYNAGCRCDACREASRLARARQREAERCQFGSPVNGMQSHHRTDRRLRR